MTANKKGYSVGKGKAGLVIITMVLLLIAITMAYRNAIILRMANHYLAKQPLTTAIRVDCIDFTLNNKLDLVFNRLCLNHPQLNGQINGLTLQWSTTWQWQWTAMPQATIKTLLVDQISITATAGLNPEQKTPDQAPFSAHQFQQVFHQTMAQLSTFTLPFAVDITQLAYQPFTPDGRQRHYQGHLSATPHGIELTLADARQAPFLTAALNRTDNTLAGELKAELAPLRQLLATHGIELPMPDNAKRSAKKGAKKGEKHHPLQLTGQFDSQWQWHDFQLKAQSRLTAFNLSSSGIPVDFGNKMANTGVDSVINTGPFSLKTTIGWQTTLDQQQLQLDFNHQDVLTMHIGDQPLADWLTAQQAPPALLTLLADNPNQGFSLRPEGRWQFDFAQQQLSVAAITVHNHNRQQPLTLQLKHLELLMATESPSLRSQFDANIQAKVAALQSLTSEPIKLAASGTIDINTSNGNVDLYFAPSSQLNLSQLQWRNNNNTLNTLSTLSATAAQLHWQGSLGISQGQPLSLDLRSNGTLHQLYAPGLINIQLGQMHSRITGSSRAISIDADIEADGIELAQLSLNGDPGLTDGSGIGISLQGKDLSLIDLLAAGPGKQITDTLSVELIDGSLSYALDGQLTRFDALSQNALKLSLSVHNMSVQINEFWLQDLNWQQQLTIEAGNIIAYGQPGNLSLAVAEAGDHQFTDLLATSRFSLIQPGFSLVVDNLSGKAFGGGFSVASIHWPLFPQQASGEVVGEIPGEPLILQLDGIELSELIALEQQQNIVVSGRISGQLPLTFYPSGITIDAGELHNISDGVIQIKDNPAIEELKQSQPELRLAFDALQNLHYHQLTSAVTMNKAGQMLLETAIKGINPDFDNEVNFNLNLDYDLLGLIESLRITDTFEQQIDKNIKQ